MAVQGYNILKDIKLGTVVDEVVNYYKGKPPHKLTTDAANAKNLKRIQFFTELSAKIGEHTDIFEKLRYVKLLLLIIIFHLRKSPILVI